VDAELVKLAKEDPSASVFREDWNVKSARIRANSPFGSYPSWRLLSAVVKSGADLRQEVLALQLIREMQRIWDEEKVPVWVHYFRVLVTSDHSGLIETVKNSISLHSIKKEGYAKKRKEFGVLDYFLQEFGPIDSPKFLAAQDAFLRSLAGYSIACFLLQIKDRHNGNILIDSDGHIIHIDFGFMLSNSPGSVGFELAPFKLPQEFIDVLGGVNSPKFAEYRSLCKDAFKAVRKRWDVIVGLVEVMEKGADNPIGSTSKPSTVYIPPTSILGIFGGDNPSTSGPSDSTSSLSSTASGGLSASGTVVMGEAGTNSSLPVSARLRERFKLGLTEFQIGEMVDRLIDQSLNSVFSKLYDYFQLYANGICIRIHNLHTQLSRISFVQRSTLDSMHEEEINGEGASSAAHAWDDEIQPQPVGAPEMAQPVFPRAPTAPTNETTPLLGTQHQPSTLVPGSSLPSSVGSAWRNTVDSTRASLAAEYGPGWRQLKRTAAERTAQAEEGLKNWWARTKESAHERFMEVMEKWDDLHKHVNSNYTIEEKNWGCLALAILVFLLFLWIYAAVLAFVPYHKHVTPPAPPERGPRPDLPAPVPAPPKPLPEPEPAVLCTSMDCVLTAGMILQSLDQAVDPCDDFYEFSCGGWAKANPLPEHVASISAASNLQKSVQRAVKSILSSPYPGMSALPTTNINDTVLLFNKMRTIYTSCQEEGAINSRGVEPLSNLLASRIAQHFPILVPVFPGGTAKLRKDRLALALSAFHAFNSYPFFYMTVAPSPVQFMRNIPVLVPWQHLGLPKDRYQDDTAVQAYKQALTKILSMVFEALPFEMAATRSYYQLASDVAEFEASLAAVTPSRESIVHSYQDTVTVVQLAEVAPNFLWTEYFDMRFNVSEHHEAAASPLVRVLGGTAYFEGASKLVGEAPPEVVEAYILWTAIQELAPFVATELEKAMAPIREVRGEEASNKNRRDFCVGVVEKYTGDLIGKYFAEAFISAADKSAATDAFENVRAYVEEHISNAKWMEEDSKTVAVEKLSKLLISAGFVDEHVNSAYLSNKYAGLDPGSEQEFFEAIVMAREIDVFETLSQISEPTDRKRSWTITTDLDASYKMIQNALFAPAGFLQYPSFSTSLPSYFNYGSVGSVVAARIVHAIDGMGRYYDQDGIMRDWYTPKTAYHVNANSQCFVDQYSAFHVTDPEVGEEVYLDGKKGKLANIADSWGLELAFQAWKRDRFMVGAAVKNPILPGLEGYTNEQLFFIGFAARECANLTPEARLKTVKSGMTSPGEFKVRGAVANSVEFAKAFQCWADAPMNPSNKCKI
ncbi:Phosphatidylinositol 4-kinase pik1alpha (PI4-kinase)(PtdIns-4-kinase), partial [Irineochytrium annulatum]